LRPVSLPLSSTAPPTPPQNTLAASQLSNITFSVLFGVIRFFWQVVGVIRDYNAGFISGVAFFALCLIVGLSFFALTCAAVTAAGAAVVGGAALLLQNAAQQQRLRQARREHRD
jgi:hypothetical protein